MKRSEMTPRLRASLNAAAEARTWLTKAHPDEYRRYYLEAKGEGLSPQRAQTRAKTRLVRAHRDLYVTVRSDKYERSLAKLGLTRVRAPR